MQAVSPGNTVPSRLPTELCDKGARIDGISLESGEMFAITGYHKAKNCLISLASL